MVGEGKTHVDVPRPIESKRLSLHKKYVKMIHYILEYVRPLPAASLADTITMPPDQPLGQPPPIAGPVQGVTAINGQAQQRRGDQRRPPLPGKAVSEGQSPAEAIAAAEPSPPDALVVALDRLRATAERPVDLEVARLLRGRREYGAGEASGAHPTTG